jgi:hypothetical protein
LISEHLKPDSTPGKKQHSKDQLSHHHSLPEDADNLGKDGDLSEPLPFDIEGKPHIANRIIDVSA